MNYTKYFLIWSTICFSFIAVLCVLFNSAMPLWLLLIWLIGCRDSKK